MIRSAVAGQSLRAVAHDPAMWQIPLFVAEIDNLREHLGLDEVQPASDSHGGGMLAIEYALSGATGIRSVTLQSTPRRASRNGRREARRPVDGRCPPTCRRRWPPMNGVKPHPAFAAAVAEYERRYIMRLADPPQCWRRRTELVAMGHRGVRVHGRRLRGRPAAGKARSQTGDRRPQLAEITLPTLLLSGRHDLRDAARHANAPTTGSAGSEWHILENSSHSCQARGTGAGRSCLSPTSSPGWTPAGCRRWRREGRPLRCAGVRPRRSGCEWCRKAPAERR